MEAKKILKENWTSLVLMFAGTCFTIYGSYCAFVSTNCSNNPLLILDFNWVTVTAYGLAILAFGTSTHYTAENETKIEELNTKLEEIKTLLKNQKNRRNKK